jgi:stage V sporulation protein B
LSPARRSGADAGRGGLAVLGAKIFFILAGLIQQTLLPRAIGLASYGALSRVLALSNILNNVVVASSTQGVSRAVARCIGAEKKTLRTTFGVHAALALVLGLGFAAIGPSLASFEGAAYIARPLLCMSFVLLFYGLYAPIIGLLNGRQQFVRQAFLDVTFAVLRTFGLLGAGRWFVLQGGSGVLGSALGFALASAVIVPLAAVFAFGRSKPSFLSSQRPDPVPLDTVNAAKATQWSSYLAELGPLAAVQFFTNLLMQIDITLLGHFLSRGGDAKSADEWVAVYRACQLFAFLPYQLLLSVTQVLFPLLARAMAEGDREAIRRYVERGTRLALIACGTLVTVIVALPSQLLALAYRQDVADRGAATLGILALGQGAYALLAIATTVLASLGRERLSALITVGAALAVVAGCVLLVESSSFGASELRAAATGTSIAMVLALLVAGIAVRRVAGAFIRISSVTRVVFALAVVAAMARVAPIHAGPVSTVLLASMVAAGFLAVLVVTRELTKSDAEALRSVRRAP